MSRPVVLLDSNVLIALTSAEHVSHQKTTNWLKSAKADVATCPITQGALVRFHAHLAQTAGFQLAQDILKALDAQPWHRFLPDDLPYTAIPARGLRGHKQVTDLYLVSLAKAHGGRLATLDQSLAAWHPEACTLIK